MRLVTYSHAGAAPAAGIVLDGRVVSLGRIGYADVISFLRDGEKAIAAAQGLFSDPGAPKLEEVKLHAPVPKPDKFICIGLNYRDHAIESGMAIPDLPTVFTKYPNAICGNGDEIVLPSVSKQVDYEAEFAFVIGKTCKNVPKENWKDVIFGYTIVHDVSARDYQLATSQWTIGKTFDTFGPMGPTLVSKDEIEDPHNLRISLDLNGQTLQDSNTSQFVFDIPYLVNYLSTVMTLEPGDIISTGTPPGVGFARKPPIFLKPGDDVVVKIEGLGELRNPCVSD
ncbi:MAG: 5-oxopent-3-ene-1,2,5-tricarboxylate decarboxylase [Acidobacteria bacterium]|nr:5-oxopent-3-ene-1,2,5-tricarboxylate decarboxylase [Acidobacteriota bacterium]